jgi:hypothetical protein
MAKYWMTQTRFIKQRGDMEPQIVHAFPNAPTLVDLPDDMKASADMTPVDEPPEKVAPAHAVATRVERTQTAPERMATGKRLADR